MLKKISIVLVIYFGCMLFLLFVESYDFGNRYKINPELMEHKTPSMRTFTFEYDYTGTVVGSGSMFPYIKKDSYIYLKKINETTPLGIDDIIVYSEDEHKIIHSIYYIYQCNNETFYLMKGIGNDYVDEQPIKREQMIDVVVGILPIELIS